MQFQQGTVTTMTVIVCVSSFHEVDPVGAVEVDTAAVAADSEEAMEAEEGVEVDEGVAVDHRPGDLITGVSCPVCILTASE